MLSINLINIENKLKANIPNCTDLNDIKAGFELFEKQLVAMDLNNRDIYKLLIQKSKYIRKKVKKFLNHNNQDIIAGLVETYKTYKIEQTLGNYIREIETTKPIDLKYIDGEYLLVDNNCLNIFPKDLCQYFNTSWKKLKQVLNKNIGSSLMKVYDDKFIREEKVYANSATVNEAYTSLKELEEHFYQVKDSTSAEYKKKTLPKDLCSYFQLTNSQLEIIMNYLLDEKERKIILILYFTNFSLNPINSNIFTINQIKEILEIIEKYLISIGLLKGKEIGKEENTMKEKRIEKKPRKSQKNLIEYFNQYPESFVRAYLPMIVNKSIMKDDIFIVYDPETLCENEGLGLSKTEKSRIRTYICNGLANNMEKQYNKFLQENPTPVITPEKVEEEIPSFTEDSNEDYVVQPLESSTPNIPVANSMVLNNDELFVFNVYIRLMGRPEVNILQYLSIMGIEEEQANILLKSIREKLLGSMNYNTKEIVVNTTAEEGISFK